MNDYPSSSFESIPLYTSARKTSNIETSGEEAVEAAAARPSQRKSEFRANHSIHDRLQTETNFTFELRPRSESEESRDFRADIYLFFPNSMGVNSSTFTTDEFFRHRTSLYRIRAPLYLNLRNIEPEDLRFESAEKYFDEHLSSIERRRISKRVVQDVRLFGNFLHTELKKLRSSVSSSRKTNRVEQRRELAEYLLHHARLLWVFRERYLAPIRKERYLLDDEVIRVFNLTDEYLSYRLEIVLLQSRERLVENREELEELLAREMEYRERNGLLVLSANRQSRTFEAYTYRLGLLKKYMGEALFVTLDSNKKDNLYRNYAAAVGAGLAALFAGIVEMQRAQYLTGNDSGMRLAFLIGVAVVAYIFKDRVKDLSKEYFNIRLKEWLPDESFRMTHVTYSSGGKPKVRVLGEVSEYLRFLKEVPADIAYLRTLGQTLTSDPERRESVMHMGRRFRFELKAGSRRRLFPLLKNVHRIDLSPFLTKLDNPTVPVTYYDEGGKATTVQAPKVYHINIVIRYETNFGDQVEARKVDYERFRLIMNKNGIIRMEQILERGRLEYEERAL